MRSLSATKHPQIPEFLDIFSLDTGQKRQNNWTSHTIIPPIILSFSCSLLQFYAFKRRFIKAGTTTKLAPQALNCYAAKNYA